MSLVILTPSHTEAQTGARDGKRPAKKNQAAANRTPTRAAQLRRRAEALGEAAEAARLVADDFQRARLLAAVAEAMWKFDEPRARTLLAHAWDAATDADGNADAEILSANSDQPQNPSASSEARDYVLLVAARLDGELADNFLRGMKERVEEGSATTDSATQDAQAGRDSPWGELTVGGRQRLDLALRLLAGGASNSARHAATIAAPVIAEGVNAWTMEFLIRLRRFDANAADNLYARLLLVARNQPANLDANDALLAGSYIVAPTLLAVVDSSGGLQLRYVHSQPQVLTASASTVPSVVRAAFADFASAVLMRPPPTVTERGATVHYFALERLLPFFAAENHPALLALRVRRDELANAHDASRRASLARSTEEPLNTGRGNTADSLRFSRDRLRSLPEGAARDEVRLELVRSAARRRRWADARLAAADIGDPALKTRAERLIRTNQIANLRSSYSTSEKDDFVRARRFVEESDVTTVWRAWGYAQAAELAFGRKAIKQSHTLLDEALAHAERTSPNTDEQVAAFGLVTLAALDVDRRRVPALLARFVNAVNAHEDFTNEIYVADADEMEDEDAPAVTSLDELFGVVARNDFTLALAEARNIERHAPRSHALLGVARSALISSSLPSNRAFLSEPRLTHKPL